MPAHPPGSPDDVDGAAHLGVAERGLVLDAVLLAGQAPGRAPPPPGLSGRCSMATAHFMPARQSVDAPVVRFRARRARWARGCAARSAEVISETGLSLRQTVAPVPHRIRVGGSCAPRSAGRSAGPAEVVAEADAGSRLATGSMDGPAVQGQGLRTRRGNVVALGPCSSAAGEISRPALPSVAGVRVACGDPQGQPQRTQRPLSLSCHARRLKNNPTGEHPER